MSNNSQLTTNEPDFRPATKAVKKSGNRIGLNYVILKSLKQSPKNDVIKCFYMKSITDFGFCVIKEGSCNQQKDKEGRDIKDRLVWQKHMHETLEKRLRIPRFIGSFEENGNYYLAIELISGNSLAGILRKHGVKVRVGVISGNRLGRRIIRYIIQFIELLQCLHANRVIHRDVTATNFMVSRLGKAYLIDMELSYSVDEYCPNPPFQLGTHGYMSPEQLAAQTPTIKEDVFAFGAILLQIWSNIAPVKLTESASADLMEKVAYFIPDSKISSIVSQCLSKDANDRPDLQIVKETFENYYRDLSKGKKRSVNPAVKYSESAIGNVIQSTINTFSTSLLSEEQRGWFAEDKNADKDKGKLKRAWYASFHLGCSGVLYMLARAKGLGYDIGMNKLNISRSVEMIDRKYIQASNSVSGLHFGADGVAISLCTAIKSNLLDNITVDEQWIEHLLSRESQSGLDIMNGVSGKIMANLICLDQKPTDEMMVRLNLYTEEVLRRQQNDGAWMRGSETVKGKKRVTKGFAYGLAGITYALLEYSRVSGDHRSRESALSALVWLVRAAKWSAGKMYWTSSIGKMVDPWWSDGGPGVALSFIKAFELTDNQQFKHYATAALKEEKDLIYYGNLSQCNGISGLGEIYLEAFRVFKEEYWLERASSIAQLLMRLVKSHPKHGTYWLSESEPQPIPGFMLGNAGILHFLLRFLNHSKLSLPLALDSCSSDTLIKGATYLHQPVISTLHI